MIRPTGLAPRRPEERERLAAEQSFGADFGDAPLETVIQQVAFVRNQLNKPSCVGQAFAAGVDAKLQEAGMGPPWCSAVDLWRDARRRQGNLERIEFGTRAEYVIESLMKRGWSPYTVGEDTRPDDVEDEKPSLRSEMFAHAKRQVGVVHYDIPRNRRSSIVAALRNGYVVGIGVGCKAPFFHPTATRDRILGGDFVGGDSYLHEMRVVGFVADMDAFLVQNSWGEAWAGAELDRPYHGCCFLSTEVVEEAWDVDALEVRVRPVS